MRLNLSLEDRGIKHFFAPVTYESQFVCVLYIKMTLCQIYPMRVWINISGFSTEGEGSNSSFFQWYQHTLTRRLSLTKKEKKKKKEISSSSSRLQGPTNNSRNVSSSRSADASNSTNYSQILKTVIFRLNSKVTKVFSGVSSSTTFKDILQVP